MGTTVMKFVGGITYGPNTFTFPQVVATQVAITGDGTGATCLVQRYDNLTNGSFLTLKKTRGSVAAPLAVNSGDTCGGVSYQGYGGTNNRDIATIVCYVDTYTSDTNISGGLLFSTNGGSTGVTERLRINPAGNVGIGTSSPTQKLTIVGALQTTSNSASFDQTGVQLDYTAGAGRLASYVSTGSNLQFFTNASSGSASEKMRIDSSGNVGIGTSSPTQKLTIVGALQTTSNSASFDQTGVQLDYTAGAGRLASYVSTGSNLQFFTNASSGSASEKMRIDSSGNVGIGTSTPNTSAILDAQSTTKGVRFPNMTTTQKTAISSPAAGLVVFDTTLAKLCVYSGAAWQTITSI